MSPGNGWTKLSIVMVLTGTVAFLTRSAPNKTNQSLVRFADACTQPVLSPAETLQMRWLQGSGRSEISEICVVAQLINRLLKHDAPPSDFMKALPTPTPAAWKALTISLFVVFTADTFFSSLEPSAISYISVMSECEQDLLAVQHAIVEMPYNLIGGHLPNLELDVTLVMR